MQKLSSSGWTLYVATGTLLAVRLKRRALFEVPNHITRDSADTRAQRLPLAINVQHSVIL